jgi:predicted phosphodiesterase
MTTRLLIYSDLHLEFGPFEVPLGLGYDVVILAGDISSDAVGAVRWALGPTTFPAAKAIIYVPGNHEYYGETMQDVQAQLRECASGTRLHVLDGDEAVIDGVRYLGCTLWTGFGLRIATPVGSVSDASRGIGAARRSMMDYRCIDILDDRNGDESQPARRRRLRPEDTLAIHREQREWLRCRLDEPFDGPTVVVTHTAPHRGSLAQRYAGDWVSTAFVDELPEAFFAAPRLWVHGHTHTSFDYRVGSCRIVSNPRGYVREDQARPENRDFDERLLVALT